MAAPFYIKPHCGDIALCYRERSVTARVISATKVVKVGGFIHSSFFVVTFSDSIGYMDKGIKDLDSIELRKRTYASLCLRGLMISGLLGTIMLTSTNPVIGGPKVILVFLSIVFIFLFCLYCLLIQIIIRIAGYGTRALDTRLIYCSIILAIGSIFLIGLQTLGQLGLADIVLVSTFVAILMFYIIRRF